MRYLGERYDVVMKCIKRGGTFTAYEIGVNPHIMKGLAEGGYLKIIGERPYSYMVPAKVRQRYE